MTVGPESLAPETPCPARADRQHCREWYDGEPCCACDDPGLLPIVRVMQLALDAGDEPVPVRKLVEATGLLTVVGFVVVGRLAGRGWLESPGPREDGRLAAYVVPLQLRERARREVADAAESIGLRP